MLTRPSNGTIFSLPIDIAVFILPLFFPAAIIAAGWQGRSGFWVFATFMSLKHLLDSAHLSATVYAAVHRAQVGQVSRWLVYSSPLVIAAGGTILFNIDPRFLVGLTAYWSFFHLYRQQHGFVMISRAKANESVTTRCLDTAMMINLIQYPLLHLHHSSLKTNSYMGSPLLLSVNDGVMTVSAAIFWAGNVLYLAYCIYSYRRHRTVNLGKLIILLNTGVVYYGCLVFAENFWLWAMCHGLTHGLSYVALTYQSSFCGKFAHHQFPKDRLAKILFASHLLYIPVVIALAILVRQSHKATSMLPFGIAEWILPIFMLPGLIHFYLDTFIWRKPQPRVSASAPRRYLVPVND